MSISDLAKDTLRIAQTAGLGKDVIDLLTQKVTLLDEKLSYTTISLENALVRISDLESENQDLRKLLGAESASVEPIEDELARILTFLSDEQPKAREQIGSAAGFLSNELSQMLTRLESAGLIRIAQHGSIRIMSPIGRGRSQNGTPTLYRITSKGTAYLKTNRREDGTGSIAADRN